MHGVVRRVAVLMLGAGLVGVGAALASGSAPIPSSTASGLSVQAQPRAGSCHAVGRGLFVRPDPRCTPGALNPAVRQDTIGSTICVRGWTSTVRPPERVTEPEKLASMAAYGDRGSPARFEYDHFVPLELGGATNDRRNLWPEPGASPNPKDSVENALRAAVCAGRLSLARAQHEIVANWVTLYRAARAHGPGPTGGAARCSVSAAYSARYGDWDVYVHSNQPDRPVTVTAADGATATWHTDSTGYADVYLRDGRSAAGERVTVRAGGARCSTVL